MIGNRYCDGLYRTVKTGVVTDTTGPWTQCSLLGERRQLLWRTLQDREHSVHCQVIGDRCCDEHYRTVKTGVVTDTVDWVWSPGVCPVVTPGWTWRVQGPRAACRSTMDTGLHAPFKSLCTDSPVGPADRSTVFLPPHLLSLSPRTITSSPLTGIGPPPPTSTPTPHPFLPWLNNTVHSTRNARAVPWFVSLTPSLPQSVRFPGRITHGRACKQNILLSYNICFQFCVFWWRSFHMPVRKSRQNGLRVMMMKCCLMSSDVSWHIRDKLRPMPKHGSI